MTAGNKFSLVVGVATIPLNNIHISSMPIIVQRRKLVFWPKEFEMAAASLVMPLNFLEGVTRLMQLKDVLAPVSSF